MGSTSPRTVTIRKSRNTSLEDARGKMGNTSPGRRNGEHEPRRRQPESNER
jgi:hypothetical protein